MNVATPISFMPALGTQIVAMMTFANACNHVEPDDARVQEAWQEVNRIVVDPFGMKIEGEPADVREACGMLAFMVPHVREKFDDRIARLFQEPVTRKVIYEQRINPERIKDAMEMDLISAVHAYPLIQQTLTIEGSKWLKNKVVRYTFIPPLILSVIVGTSLFLGGLVFNSDMAVLAGVAVLTTTFLSTIVALAGNRFSPRATDKSSKLYMELFEDDEE